MKNLTRYQANKLIEKIMSNARVREFANDIEEIINSCVTDAQCILNVPDDDGNLVNVYIPDRDC